MVTFRQVDPLYTLDLADPERPRILGELKIPGFSAYLHPLGGGLLLGLGEDADRDGTSTGGQAAVFDLADLGDVRRADRVALGRLGAVRGGLGAAAFTLPSPSVGSPSRGSTTGGAAEAGCWPCASAAPATSRGPAPGGWADGAAAGHGPSRSTATGWPWWVTACGSST